MVTENTAIAMPSSRPRDSANAMPSALPYNKAKVISKHAQSLIGDDIIQILPKVAFALR